MRSLKASPEGLKKIRQARERITEETGWVVDDERWLDEISKHLPPVKNGKNIVPGRLSIPTWKRFLAGKEAIKATNFRACCQALGLNWEEVVEKKSNQNNQNSMLLNPSLTLYAFHLRTSINYQVVPEASQLWEKLVEFGELLKIEELQNIRQELICYRNNLFYPEAEDLQEIEPLTLLKNRENELRFSVDSQLTGLFCPFRLHDTYAIDLTISSEGAIRLEKLNYLNPQSLLLPSRVQASLGQTLLFYAEVSSSNEETYQALADDCAARLIPESEHFFIEFIGKGNFLGNPIFEYESRHKTQAKRLHILVFFEQTTIPIEQIDEFSGIMLYVLWLRHKILYVFEQSQLCAKDAQLLSAKIEEYWLSKNSPGFLEKLANELPDLEKYEYLFLNLCDYQTTIEVNEANYSSLMEKVNEFNDSDFKFLDNFLSLVRQKLCKQIQFDLRYLEPGRERLQQLQEIVNKNQP